MNDNTKTFKAALIGGLALVAVSILAIVLIRAGMPGFTPISDSAIRASAMNGGLPAGMGDALDVVVWGKQNMWKIYTAYGAIAVGVISAAVGFVGLRNRRSQAGTPAPVQQAQAV